MPLNDHYVVIGNGAAGNRAALTLRKEDPDARITIISDESIHFYYKHKLTSFIAGEISEQDLLVKPCDRYEEKQIRLRLGQCVDRVDFMEKVIFLKHMEKVHFTKLIIASGSRPGTLNSMAGFADNLTHVTCYNDVVLLAESIRKAGNFLILGGDLVGFKFLTMLKSMNKNVSIMLYPEAFWPFELTGDMVKIIENNLADYGVDIIADDQVSDVVSENGSYTVHTSKGPAITVDMVFCFTGLSPNIRFAMGRGIDIDHGILVNEYLKTNLDDIYACGSCAQIYNPELKSYSTSVGWPNAVIQGEVAALNMLGAGRVIKPAHQKFFDLEGVNVKTSWWETIEE